MTVQITIIGLGQIGASLGLALEKHKKNIIRIGHDKDMNIAKKAEGMGAVDKIKRNLPVSVEGSDIVILALPFDEIEETLGYIKLDLKDDVVILDTAPNKAIISRWMEETERAYIGLAPALNPLYLEEKHRGVETAHADLFHNAVTMIAAPLTAAEEVLQLATDFVTLIGSSPLFADIAEVDGVMAFAQMLPQLTAAALLDATIDMPGWVETRKIAGLPYVQSTEASQNHAGDAVLSASLLLGNPGSLRVLDAIIQSLQTIRAEVESGDAQALDERLNAATEARFLWLKERNRAEWLPDGGDTAPRLGGFAERIFGFKQRK